MKIAGGSGRRRRFRTAVILLTIPLQFIAAAFISCFLVFYGPFVTARNYIVETAMSTYKHQYLARMFLSDSAINKILNGNEAVKAEKQQITNVSVRSTPSRSIEQYEINGGHYHGSLTGIADSITDIDMSAQTDLTFLKATSGSRNSKIWESNIMVSTNPLPNTVTNDIGKIACLKRSETLFYESASSRKVYKYGNHTPININGVSDLRILGVDQNDNIYFASVTGEQVNCIYYGTFKDNNWNKINVYQSIKISLIYLTYQGSLYENFPSSNTISKSLNSYKTKLYR